MEYNRNFFIAIGLSFVMILAWNFIYVAPKNAEQQKATEIAQQIEAEKAQIAGDSGTQQPVVLPGQNQHIDISLELRDASLAASPRVEIDTASLKGSINLKGALFDDLLLNNYHLTVDKASPRIALLNPAQFNQGYIATFGFTNAASGSDIGAVPGLGTEWQVEGNNKLTETTPVTLVFKNDKGLTFRRVISIDQHYMFTIADSVSNESGAPVSLRSFGLVARTAEPSEGSAGMLLHEGLIGALGDQGVKTFEYKKLAEVGDTKTQNIENFDSAVGGWLGVTDKYWAVTIIPDQASEHTSRFYFLKNGATRFNAEFSRLPVAINNGETFTFTNNLFAGAKRVDILNHYQDDMKIDKFALLIDWGYLRMITQPMFSLIDFLYKLTGNFGIAILLVTVILKAVLFPLANKSYKSMARMKVVQPKMQEIREKYGDDRQKQQAAIMELYKTEKINPVAGCWPLLIQMPIFFALYKVLYITLEMRHAPFFGWIQDLAAPDPTSLFNLFGLLPYHVPAFLMIGAWPLLMGITMFLQMRMNPTPPDPTQAMIFTWMPLVFTFMLAAFPAGLVIYWAWNNFLSIIQQGIIMKRQGAKIELWDNLKGLFKKKAKGA